MKKIFIFALISILMTFNFSFAYTKIYDMKLEEIPIASGVSYKNIKRLTTGGWLNINVLKADLTNKYVNINMLTSPTGLHNLQSVKDQAVANNAIAAVNADFFGWDGGKATGYPIGFTMKNSDITSSAYYKNEITDSMATFLLDSNKNPFFEYIKMDKMEISNESGEIMKIAEINKISNDYLNPVIFTPEFGKTSPGNSKLWDTVEFVVDSDVLKEIRDCQEGAVIPKNGYVICARLDNAYKIKCMFNIGDKVNLDIETNINTDKITTAVSGGGILVKDGVAKTTFTHDISGYQPRTAIGTDKSGKTLYMVTVDGRGISKGATQAELAFLMNEVGCFSALNLDGGGSTAMVGRLAGTGVLSTLNVPTETRKVVSSIGIISTAPKSGDVKDLIIKATNENVFRGYETELNVSAYDEYINPVTVNNSSVKWKVNGVDGTVKSGVFKPTSSGIAKVTATYKGVSKDIEIRVLGDIGEITAGSREITLAEGQTYALPITVKDLEGYSAQYNATDLKFTTSNDNCSIDKNGVITANKYGSTLVTIIAGKTAKSFVKVNVTGEYEKLLDGFEKASVTFTGYPEDEVEGSVKLSSKEHNGDKSLQLSYDFALTDVTRGAYAVFKEPIDLPEDAVKLKLWAYSKKKQDSVLLKIKIEDANSEIKLIEVSNGLKADWNEYEADLTNIALPARIERIYVAQLEGTTGVDSSIYFDDLRVFGKGNVKDSAIVLPNNTKPMDLSNCEEKVGKNGFNFMFYGNAENDGTLYDLIKINKLNEVVKDSKFVILGNGSLESNTDDQIIINGKYYFYDEGDLAIIKLANNGSGLLATYTEQWNWLVNKLNETKAKNLLVVMPNIVEESFKDQQEKILFKQVIKEYEDKNNARVTFLTLGEESTFSMYEGTKTIFAGTRKYDTVRGNVFNDKYILFTVNGDKLTYQILSLFE